MVFLRRKRIAIFLVYRPPRSPLSELSFVQELGLSTTSTWRILRRDLGLHPYKIQLTQEFKVNDHRQRRVFANWVLEQLEVNSNFAKQIIFSDEIHFRRFQYASKEESRQYILVQGILASQQSRFKSLGLLRMERS
ncbi:hypothetical protein ALC53_04546 [Atta colombica]|uniref:Transposase Tc1-like domain-containing protein n=1 Tax=Atta colombica TaxID=520822 RepID=A0A195BJF2_9HYME|nr:hypothetical protein ALC53_04546 [Atta colombica]